MSPNGRNAGRLFADCTNLYGYGEWHALRALERPRLRRLFRRKTHECVHCHRRFRPGDTDGEWNVGREALTPQQRAAGQQGSQ